MKISWLIGAVLFAGGLVIAGVMSSNRGPTEDPPSGGPAVNETIRLGEETDVNLAEWLKLPREKLAEKAHDSRDRLENSLKTVYRTDAESLLLEKLRLPLSVPVLAEAKYSEAVGISLPPYAKEGEKDADLALHLARHGDCEAARKLAGPEDQKLLEQIEALQGERNYPVEWTRLVALTLQEAELKMATGDTEGATELVLVQRQLRALLDKKSAAGPLGADLLPIGMQALREAVKAWRESKNRLPLVADEIEQSLKDWGEPPIQQPTLKPGASRSEVARLFKGGAAGPILAAHTPNALLRLLDLQDMPIVTERLIGALAFFDEKDQLGELWYLYPATISELFPDTTNLAFHLIDQSASAGSVEKVAGLARQSWTAGALVYEFTLTPARSRALGAVLRVTAPGAKPLPSRLPADPLNLGLVNLNRTYDHTRCELMPGVVSGKPLELKKGEAKQAELLAKLSVPVGEARPDLAVFSKVKDADLFDSLTLSWSAEENMSNRAWPKLLLPLWSAYGPCQLIGAEQHLNLLWEQSPTQVQLSFPYDSSESPELVYRDTRGKELAERLKSAVALDEQVRKQRLEGDKPLVRLPRALHWLNLELGISREQASKELPQDLKSRPMIKTADGSFSMLFSGVLAVDSASPAQLVLRYTPDNKLAEVRIRYREVPVKAGTKVPSLLDRLKKANGEPEALPAPWLGLWTDTAQSKHPPVFYCWQDDRTRLTYQADPYCMEVVLTDCPADQPQGVKLPKLEVCSRGVEFCHLGDRREDLIRRWKPTATSTTADGGLVLFQPAKSPYDLCVVYFENGKVSRILGRYRAVPSSTSEDFTTALQKHWTSDADRLGVIRRIDQVQNLETGDLVVRGYSWNDDRTRVHTFVEKTKEGHRTYTEWRDWPIPAKAKETTVKR